jgi:DNA-binding LacI/PurR family transcriptional regulator
VGARSLRSALRDSVGVTIPAPMADVPVSQKFFIRLFAQLHRLFGTHGQYICFDINPYTRGDNVSYARGLWEQRYWGCVLCGPLSLNDTTVRRIHESGNPYLSLGRLDSLRECSSATVDYEEAAIMSVQFLLKRGHRRIGLLRGFHGYQPGLDRERGYRRAMMEAGLPMGTDLVRDVSFASQDIVNAVHRLLLAPDVTAIIDASGAEDGGSLREGCHRAGRTLGRDVDVVAWTYSADASVLRDAAAHIWLPVWQAAVEGLEEFAQWFNGEREGPIQVKYRPTLYDVPLGEEAPRPANLFDVSD